MAKISELSKKIEALSESMVKTRDIFIEDSSHRIKIGKDFYNNFFNQLIIEFDPIKNENEIIKAWDNFFGSETEEIRFLAVDGTSYNVQGKNFVTFYGGAFGIIGIIRKDTDMKNIIYPDPSKFKKAEGVIAYAPIPYSELIYIEDDVPITLEQEEKISLLGIHNKLMGFAELYLIYNEVAKEKDYPNCIMYDGSISSKQMTLTRSFQTYNLNMKINDSGKKREILKTDYNQILIRPFNTSMYHPSKIKQHSKNNITIKEDIWNNWIALMEEKGKKLFDKNDWTALYEEYEEEYEIDGKKTVIQRKKWLTGDDLDVLSLITLTRIIEICWEKRILFIGVSKDSGVSYLTKRYVDRMKRLSIEPYNSLINIPPIMYTDILFLESVSLDFNSNMWTTIEYDSSFATLQWDDTNKCLTGIRTIYWSPEVLFLKSIASLYKHKEEDLGYELISIDRLAYEHDLKSIITTKFAWKDKLIGDINLVLYKDKNAKNEIQLLMLYLLLKCCRNRNIEAIGYPHPLFLADKFAKNYLDMVKPIMIKGNKIFFRHPKFWTRRQHRSSAESRRR